MRTLEISGQPRAAAIASLQRYFAESLPEPLGELQAGLLLNFFVDEVGPAIYNQAIADAQRHLQQRVLDLNGELFAEEFPYWPRVEAKRKRR